VLNLDAPELAERREILEIALLFLLKKVMGELEERDEELFFEDLPEEEVNYLETPNCSYPFNGLTPMAVLRGVIENQLGRIKMLVR
jgi:hypothetical protein